MSFYRNVVWYMRGLSQYTKDGYEAASKHFTASDIQVDLEGHVSLVTGANSGLGKVMAKELASRGAVVHMLCRSKERGEEAQKEIQSVAKVHDRVHLHLADLSKPSAVAQFVRTFLTCESQLHILVNNAGCMRHERSNTEGDIETNFATNTLAVFMITEDLRPLMETSANEPKGIKPRVITVSSGGMLVQKLNCQDPQLTRMHPFDGTMAYAQQKRQQVELTEVWAQRYPKIFFASMHPGWADTPAVAEAMPDFYEKMKGKLRTAEEGADTILWLAVSKAALQQPSGAFFQDRVPVSTHLPLAWTRSSAEDKQRFYATVKVLCEKFMPVPV